MVDVTTYHVPGPRPMDQQIHVVRDFRVDVPSPLVPAMNVLCHRIIVRLRVT